MNEKPIRKPRNVKINPDVLLKARVEALRSKKTDGPRIAENMEQVPEEIQKLIEAILKGK